MVGVNYCCIPGCRTKYGRNPMFAKKSHIGLFSQPKNEEELDRWRTAVKRTDKQMKIGDKVCELHFTEDDINRYYETLLPDGTVWRMKRSRCTIKPGSVPTIFPNSKNVSKKGKSENSIKKSPEKRKIPKNTYSYSKKRKIINKNLECEKNTLNTDHEHSVMTVNDKSSESAEIVENRDSEHSVMTMTNVSENENSEHSIIAVNHNVPVNLGIVKKENLEYPTMTENVETIENENSELAEIILNETEVFTYSTLVNNLKFLSRPDWSWGISAHDEFVMCAKWNRDTTLLKRVIIDCNLKIRVFLKNRAIDFNNVKISSIKELDSILMEVDRYRMCVNVNNREKTKCDGYILPKMKSILCEYCRLIGAWEVNKKQNTSIYWLSKGRNFAKHQILYEKIDILNKKNALLKEQLSKLIKIKAVWKLSNQTNTIEK